VLAPLGVCVTWNNPDPSDLIVKISPRVWLSLSHRRNTIFPFETVPFEAAEIAAAAAAGATNATAGTPPPDMPSSTPTATISLILLDLRAAEWTGPRTYEIRDDARRFENSETNYAGKIGLGVAVRYALSWGLEAIGTRVTHWRRACASASRTSTGNRA
jgi:hypothetical protein